MKNRTIIFLSLLLSYLAGYSQNARVIGYLPTYRFANSNQMEFCKLTHLNICFANPDSFGNIVMTSIGSVIANAKSKNPNIVIMISMAGGKLTTQESIDWANAIDIPANRTVFIAKLVDYIIFNNLDGADIDLEWEHVSSGYSNFIVELKSALQSERKLLSATFPNQTLFSNINSAALSSMDFINIMAYDATGPWNPSSPGQHSSYSYAQDGINFWKNIQGIDGKKLNLGLPFYGYDFSNSNTSTVTFKQMVMQNTSYADLDGVGNIYYNGRPTIEAKIALASEQVGGVFIWEVGQDAFNEYSLLTTIHNKYTSLGITTTNLCGNENAKLSTRSFDLEEFKLFPNPANNYLSFLNLKSKQHYTIFNIMGMKMLEGFISDQKQIDISGLVESMYFIQFENNETFKFIKK